MRSFLQKILKIEKLAGLEVHFLPDGTSIFNLTVLELKKGVISVVSKNENLSLKELKELTLEIPVVISFTGKGILIKIVEGILPSDVLVTVLPNANVDDFLFSSLTTENRSFVFLGRKDKLLGSLQELIGEGLTIIDFLIGPSAFSAILPFLGSTEPSISAGG